MKYYIAGKITGDPDFKGHFQYVSDKLQVIDSSNVVLNPALLPSGLSQGDYMRICLAMIDSCDVVVLLSNWEESEGAIIEKLYAQKKGLTLVKEEAIEVTYSFVATLGLRK